jgi:outer membrane receptor protein involved in Fe transport
MFMDEWVYATKHLFEEDDYEKTFNFFSPKAGINYNITDYLNVLANFSIAKKEPRVTDWYSRSGGPDDYQTYYDEEGNKIVEELDPETATTYEVGLGYEGIGWNLAANFYNTLYEDKMESVYTQENEYLTLNAGSAIHQGVELEANMMMNNFDVAISGTYSQNRWDEMDVEEIFGEPADEIVDKVVPFAPEQMAAFSFGYTFVDLPMDGSLRIGFSGNWWDEYYGTYTNEYEVISGYDNEGEPIWEATDAKLPYFFTINSDIAYRFKIGGKDAILKLDLKNINNREDNYSRAALSADYGRQDDYNGVDYMYVTPAPLFNAFLTAEVRF